MSVRHTLASAATIVLILIGLASDSRAHYVAGNSRYITQTCGGVVKSRHWDQDVIPVYVDNSAATGVQNTPGTGGGFWTVSAIERQVKIVISEINETLGLSTRLSYAGLWSSYLHTNAIVISVDPAYTGNGLMYASVSAACPDAHMTSVAIRFSPNSTFHAFESWYPGGGAGIQGTMLHEFMHALGLDHADAALGYGTNAVIDSSSTNMHFTKYERETLWQAYQSRGLVDPVEFKTWLSRGAQGFGQVWVESNEPLGQDESITFRPGTISSGANVQSVAWSRRTNSSSPFMDGFDRDGPIGGEFTSAFSSVSFQRDFSHPALSYDPIGNIDRIFYLAADPAACPVCQQYGYATVQKPVCWLQRTAADFAFGGCFSNPSTGTALKTITDHVSSTYEPYRKLWIVTWLDEFHVIQMLTIPATGSTQTANVLSTFGHSAWDPPAIACSGTSTGCMMVFRSRSESAPLYTVRGSISASGTWSNITTYADGGVFNQVAAPSLTYVPLAARFVLAFIGNDSKTIRTYRRSLTSATWADGVVVSSSFAASAPVVGYAHLGADDQLTVGAVKYE